MTKVKTKPWEATTVEQYKDIVKHQQKQIDELRIKLGQYKELIRRIEIEINSINTRLV
jgi:hypothetical protein